MQVQRFGWLFGATALLAANAASAQDCAKDADCGDGYVCKTGMTPGCAEAPCPADDPKCNNLPPDCAPMEYHYCEAKPCTQDSDCGDTMVCFTQTYDECSGASSPPSEPCPKDGQCPTPDPTPAIDPVCTTHSVSTCMERWAVPCKESADCGPGFDCKEQIFATCSGGGFAPPAAGDGSSGSADAGMAAGDQALPPQEMCTSEPSGMFACELKDLPCDTDDDCPSGLECAENYSGIACTDVATPAPMAGGDTPKGGSGSGSAGAGDFAAPPDAGADTPVDTCRDVKPTKACMPHNYYRALASDSAQSGNTAGGAPVDKGGSDDGAEPPTMAPKPTSSEHAASGTGSGSDPDSDGSKGETTMKTNSGCAVSAPGDNHGLLGLLSMLGLSVLALRRRKA